MIVGDTSMALQVATFAINYKVSEASSPYISTNKRDFIYDISNQRNDHSLNIRSNYRDTLSWNQSEKIDH